MKYNLAAVALVSACVSAFPNMSPELLRQLEARSEIINSLSERDLQRRQTAAQKISQAETNCGPKGPCTSFSESQLVSTTGNNAFIPPGKGDIRGPCPGLNAAANHNYLPHNGVATIEQTAVGLFAAYGIEDTLSAALAAIAVALDGDVASQTWSIGGPPPFTSVAGSLLSPPSGISYSHNNYEGDTSIGRNDAYLNHGDAYSLNATRFGYAYALGQADGSDRYTLDKFRRDVETNQQRSIANNPYYFTGLFSTTLVVPAAYNFVINFMSNHSQAEPSGYLNGAMFKQFFSVIGNYNPNDEAGAYGFTWVPGHERIPKNWYKRPSTNQYGTDDVFADLAIGWAAYPDSFRFGGNTNGVNTYQGVDIATLTGGTYNASSVTNPTDFACLVFQVQQQVIPAEAKGTINKLSAVTKLLQKYNLFAGLQCPALAKYDGSLLNKYPGHTYKPNAPGNA